MKSHNLIGMRFGRLTVIQRSENTKQGKSRWVCVCDCGRTKTKAVTSHDLISGKVRSCGCLYKESNKGRNAKHGKTNTKLYQVWSGMRRRCFSNSHHAFSRYGGRGISICEEWHDFESFYEWAMTNGYKSGLTIDRIDNDAGYSPENCRWATMKEQQNNRSDNIRIRINSVEKTASEWSCETGIPEATILWRLRNGWLQDELLLSVNLNNRIIRKELTT